MNQRCRGNLQEAPGILGYGVPSHLSLELSACLFSRRARERASVQSDPGVAPQLLSPPQSSGAAATAGPPSHPSSTLKKTSSGVSGPREDKKTSLQLAGHRESELVAS